MNTASECFSTNLRSLNDSDTVVPNIYKEQLDDLDMVAVANELLARVSTVTNSSGSSVTAAVE
jgi:hypothetical protein